MKFKMFACALLAIFSIITILPPTSAFAEDDMSKMTQGQFALWLVKEAGAIAKLPPAATGQDAINFLTSLGIVPEEGWEEDEVITEEFLMSLLGNDEDYKGLSFDDLIKKVQELLDSRLSDRNLAVFKATSSASGSAPAA